MRQCRKVQYLRISLITVIFLLVSVIYTSQYIPVLAPSATLISEAEVAPTPLTAIPSPPTPTEIPSTTLEPIQNSDTVPADATKISDMPTPAPGPTSTVTPVPSYTPIVEPTPSMTATPPPESLFDVLLRPFIQESYKRRRERRKHDKAYLHSIDHALNEGRVNWVLFLWGETHEPPAAEKAIIGTHTIISYDYRRRKLALISLTHDIRAPEVERHTHPGQKGPAIKIDQAYFTGGFDLNRTVVENATGLVVDFQVACRDSVIKRLIDHVFGLIEVDVPQSFEVIPFYLDDVKYPAGRFEKGPQKMGGIEVMRFLKALVYSPEGYYGKALENNVRKALVFQAVAEAARSRASQGSFWLHMSKWVLHETAHGHITWDFNPAVLIVNNIGAVLPNLKEIVGRTEVGPSIPSIDRALYVVDPSAGDGGVRWVDGDPNPITKRDLAEGVYPDAGKGTEIPFNADPYGDLVRDYWPSVRRLVRRFLLLL